MRKTNRGETAAAIVGGPNGPPAGPSPRRPAPGERGSIVDGLRMMVREMEAGGMTREAIAGRAGIDKGTLSKLMAGKHSPGLMTAARLASAAGKRLELVEVAKSQP